MRAPSGVSFVHGRWQSIDGLKEHSDDTVNELDAIDDWSSDKVTTAAADMMELKATVQPAMAAVRQRKKSWSQVVEAAEVGLADVEESELDESKLASKLQQQKLEQQRAVAYVNGRWTGAEEKVEGGVDSTAAEEDGTVDELDGISDFEDEQPASLSSASTSASHSSVSLPSMAVLGPSAGSSAASSPRSLQSMLDAMSDDSSRLSSAATSRHHSRQASRNPPLSTLQGAVAELDERKEEDEGDDELWAGGDDSTAVNVERSRIRDEDVDDVADVSEDVDAGRVTRAQLLTADELDDIEAFEALDDDNDDTDTQQQKHDVAAHAQPDAAAAAGRGERELKEFEVDEAWLGRVRDEERLYALARHGRSVLAMHGLTWEELSEYGRQWHHERDGSELDDVLVWVEDEDGAEDDVAGQGEDEEEEEEADELDVDDGLDDVDDELEKRLASRQNAAATHVVGVAVEDEEEDWGE